MNPVDYYDTFPAFVQGLREKYGPNPAVSYFDRKGVCTTHTYEDLCGGALALGAAFLADNLGGRHIAIVSENCYDWILSFFGIVCAGATAVCIDTEQPDPIIRQLITHADTEVVLCSPTFAEICAPLLEEGKVRRILPINSSRETALADLTAAGRALIEANAAKAPQADRDTTAAIVYTSGTTSTSKPVMLSHINMLQNASESIAMVDTLYDIFSSLPFYHSYGLTGGLLSTLVGGSHFWGNGDLRTMLRDFQSANPETIMGVPLIVETLYNLLWMQLEKNGEAEKIRQTLKTHKRMKKLGIAWGNKELVAAKEKYLGRLRLVISGGAALGLDISENLEAFGLLVLQGYGITECSPLISVNRNEFYNLGSIGPLLPSFDLKIVDGELWVRGVSVMKGYYKDPEATAQVFEDGWFKTGDLGYVDKDGFLFISGRKKNLIVLKNGKKISPEKIEALIAKIPMVQEVLVYGAASGNSADDVKPAASIYPNPAQADGLTSYEILEHLQKEIDHINQTLPTYQQIQMLSIREKEFEKTASKKIKRYTV